jgi:hypothetical protein
MQIAMPDSVALTHLISGAFEALPSGEPEYRYSTTGIAARCARATRGRRGGGVGSPRSTDVPSTLLLLDALAVPNARPASVLINELDTGGLERAANRQVVSSGQ